MSKNPWPDAWSRTSPDQDLSNLKMPNRKCKEAVWNDLVVHHCDVVVDALGMSHEGPCASMSHLASIQRRLAWEEQQKEDKRA